MMENKENQNNSNSIIININNSIISTMISTHTSMSATCR
jgi:hypothetical protein